MTCQGATTRYQPGDAIIFGMFMMHSIAPNLSVHYRISIDTRYQPKAEPTDERFFFRDDGTWLGNFYNYPEENEMPKSVANCFPQKQIAL